MTNQEIKNMMIEKMEVSSAEYRRDRAKLKLIELICYCDRYGIELNELIIDFNDMKNDLFKEELNEVLDKEENFF